MDSLVKKDSIKVNVSVNCIIKRDDKFLLVQQTRPEAVRGKWSIPGGKIDEGESFLDAVLREAREETGLVCTDAQYVGVKHEYPRETVKHFFTMSAQGDVRIPEDELLDAQWFTIDQVRTMKDKLRKPWVLSVLEDYVQNRKVGNNPRLNE